MGNHVSQVKRTLSKRNSLPSAFSPFNLLEKEQKVEKVSKKSLGARPSVPHLPMSGANDGEEVPIDDKFMSKLKDIDGEVRNSRDRGMNTIGLDKVHVGFVGFTASGRTSLIRSILGCPLSTGKKGDHILNKRTTFKKSRSVHFSETISTQLVPFYFRRLTSIVLWEISYPFEASLHIAEGKAEKREELLRNFFVEHRLNKFCLLFVCVDKDEPRAEDIAFARAARAHGKEVIFLRTKCDQFLPSSLSQEEASNLLGQKKRIFESKLESVAPDLARLQTFFVSSKTIPTLISESDDARIVAFRMMESIETRLTAADMEARSTGAPRSKSALNLEEEELMRFILNQIDDFPIDI